MTEEPIPRQMKALLKREPVPSFTLETIDVPVDLIDDEVLIRVEFAGICGSDIKVCNWTPQAATVNNLPLILGHECAGVVVKTGPKASLAVGQRVCVESHLFCGCCYVCEHGAREICPNMAQFGHGKGSIYGGCAEYTKVADKFCYPLKTSIGAREAVLLEPLGVVHNGLSRLDIKDEDILITGCGTIGLLAISVAKVLGAKRIIAMDIKDDKLEMAKKMGADDVINSSVVDVHDVIMDMTQKYGVGRICECTGVPAVVNKIFHLLRPAGKVTLIGMPKEAVHIEKPMTTIMYRALQVNTVFGRRIWNSWVESERLVAEGKVDVNAVITHQMPMTQYEDAFKALMGGDACKILMEPGK
ncbi:uncharacterized protein LOC106180999 [Lingula anatina]|uniref:Uncharacterized protein LOC106180999 n=1 Tax=Lingula anatina TaxID=7574 RepID=A0A1S3KDI8_LINAN|nr:uncharacterized protein LOC106180999 [Lingula anatina]|eukprot:XP_013420688.1 uncharacterized protein LOC106180999 [Lingula anatina]